MKELFNDVKKGYFEYATEITVSPLFFWIRLIHDHFYGLTHSNIL